MATKTKVQKVPMCSICGTFEPTCVICGKDFHIKNRKLICDGEPGGTGYHYCLSCYKNKDEQDKFQKVRL